MTGDAKADIIMVVEVNGDMDGDDGEKKGIVMMAVNIL